MNSMAADVTMYTDESVVCAGPVRAGPLLLGLGPATARARTIRTRSARSWPPSCARSPQSTFPTRRLQSVYLDPGAAGRDRPGSPQGAGAAAPQRGHRVGRGRRCAAGGRWPTGGVLRADAVVLASGHLDAEPDPGRAGPGRPRRRRRPALPAPEQTTDTDLLRARAGGDGAGPRAWAWPSST